MSTQFVVNDEVRDLFASYTYGVYAARNEVPIFCYTPGYSRPHELEILMNIQERFAHIPAVKSTREKVYLDLYALESMEHALEVLDILEAMECEGAALLFDVYED